MLADERMQVVKGFALTLLQRLNRNKCALATVVFSGEQSRILLHPTRSIQITREHITNIPCEGATPMAAGLQTTLQLIRMQKRKDPLQNIILVMLSDGEANVPLMKGGNIEKELRILAEQIYKDGTRSIIFTTDRIAQRHPTIRLLKKHLSASLYSLH